MPRVNRDVQRRLAARRERERRRPSTEPRYRFGTPGAAVDPDLSAAADTDDLTPRQTSSDVPAPTATLRPRPAASAAAAHRPFSTYTAEYAYVGGDLRRIVAVVGSLLVLLIVLYLVLPR